MDFRTKIDIPKSKLQISHQTRILMMGSCFIENIGKLLIDNKFQVNLNPFGILYNPQSIAQGLEILLKEKQFSEKDIFEYKGVYHSFWHHSTFSDVSKEVCLTRINTELDKSAKTLLEADLLFITFGTAYVFHAKEQNMVVGNCHKLPASSFERYRLDVNYIVDSWTDLIKELREANPQLKIIFTVSPIRHMKDGAHENQLSKSILLLAVDRLVQSNADTYYFPSYEIVLDELRDYRFYNEDMIHPNQVTIKYIWNRFLNVYSDTASLKIIEEWNKLYQAINHRPFDEESDEHKRFLRQTLLKLKAFQEKYPYICCEEEVHNLENR